MDTTLARSRASRLRAALRIVGVERETLVAWIAGALVLVVLFAAGVICVYRPSRVPQAAPADAWRYLLVCNQCDYRAHTLQHPRQTLAEHSGMLQCPQCGAFAATWYRRGGQVSPPGGWTIPEPAPGAPRRPATTEVQP